MPNIHFRLMALSFKFRDFFFPRRDVLREAGIRPGQRVLDYGCGPGSYVALESEMVGKKGKVYALDVQPLAIESVKKLIFRKGLKNVETILSDCDTGLPKGSVDVALLYDTFHGLGEPGKVLKEVHRVLKPAGILSVNDPHNKEEKMIAGIEKGGLFRLKAKLEKTCKFSKVM